MAEFQGGEYGDPPIEFKPLLPANPAMASGARKDVLEFIDAHREDDVRFLQKLVYFQSVTGNEAEIQAFISSWLKDSLRAEVDVWELDLEEL